MSVEVAVASAHGTCRHLVYMMSCEEFDLLVARAGGKCERCTRPEDETRRGMLVIDHDHFQGQNAVRGLLCDRCNNLMGRVDSGEVPADTLTVAYLQLSEAGRTPRPVGAVPDKANNRMARIDDDIWTRYGEIVGMRRRSADINAYVDWRIEHPTATLDEVPVEQVHQVLVTVRSTATGRRAEVNVVYGGGGKAGEELREEILDVIRKHFKPEAPARRAPAKRTPRERKAT